MDNSDFEQYSSSMCHARVVVPVPRVQNLNLYCCIEGCRTQVQMYSYCLRLRTRYDTHVRCFDGPRTSSCTRIIYYQVSQQSRHDVTHTPDGQYRIGHSFSEIARIYILVLSLLPSEVSLSLSVSAVSPVPITLSRRSPRI